MTLSRRAFLASLAAAPLAGKAAEVEYHPLVLRDSVPLQAWIASMERALPNRITDSACLDAERIRLDLPSPPLRNLTLPQYHAWLRGE